MIKFLTKLVLFSVVCFVIPEMAMHLFMPKISHHQTIEKAARLLPKVTKNTILFVGDSRIEWGIKPDIIEAKTGSPTINLAMPGSNGLDVLEYLQKEKIYPQKIIVGVNHFCPTWRNFKRIKKWENSPLENLQLQTAYWFKQHSFLYEKKSIDEYRAGNSPFFLQHNYDKKGGVIVKERGNYEERQAFQLEWFGKQVKKFDLDSLAQVYAREMDARVGHFRENGTEVYGLVMPICEDLQALENSPEIDNIFSEINFTQYFNYQKKYADNSEEIYADCSHLTPQMAREFSTFVMTALAVK